MAGEDVYVAVLFKITLTEDGGKKCTVDEIVETIHENGDFDSLQIEVQSARSNDPSVYEVETVGVRPATKEEVKSLTV